MKAASVSELKKELQEVPPAQLVELCLRLAKFKKENKELLNYLLFESHDLQAYIEAVKEEMDEAFAETTKQHIYFVKKHLRKVLRAVNKHIKYTGSKQAEVELLLYFCTKVKKSGIKVGESVALTKLYITQVKKIEKSISLQHEDLQHDYKKQLERL
ncbi:hypothetical protein [Chitinophaga sp. S165]|uniref:hypothetical protein n=1 Tax=Chitinophaga sp. S165 TaxID=2135462 RepID=UPI000D715E5E|nr:hypothetical protein [Chitinophaga sp. S165]PWV56681.1 hypothetical protein C7475_1011198 [Chitinophaga sp. S165]